MLQAWQVRSMLLTCIANRNIVWQVRYALCQVLTDEPGNQYFVECVEGPKNTSAAPRLNNVLLVISAVCISFGKHCSYTRPGNALFIKMILGVSFQGPSQNCRCDFLIAVLLPDDGLTL